MSNYVLLFKKRKKFTWDFIGLFLNVRMTTESISILLYKKGYDLILAPSKGLKRNHGYPCRSHCVPVEYNLSSKKCCFHGAMKTSSSPCGT